MKQPLVFRYLGEFHSFLNRWLGFKTVTLEPWTDLIISEDGENIDTLIMFTGKYLKLVGIPKDERVSTLVDYANQTLNGKPWEVEQP